MDGFGRRTWNMDIMVRGTKGLEEFLGEREQMVNFLGMDMAGMKPKINSYPLVDGRGGDGHSIYQPFVEPKHIYQPLTTSFLIFDIWPEFYTITIKSCIPFYPESITHFVEREFGEILDYHSWTLGRVRRD